MRIQYLDAAANAYLTLDYTLTADGLVKRIVETDLVSNGQVEYGPTVGQGGVVPGPIVAQVDFEYDARNRLTRETRTVTGAFDSDLGRSEYDLSYTYDVGGNRLTKTDLLTGRVTAYFYDIETPDTIDNKQHNNRLLGYDVNDFNPADGTPIPVEQARYKYGPAGNVMLLVKQLDMNGDGTIDVNDLAAVWWFYYSSSNQLWLAVQGTGSFDEPTGALTATTFVKAAEYRYDGGRQRYLVRQRDPSANFAIVGTDQWRDYAGNNVYNDYTVDTAGTVTNGKGYLPGIGYDDPSMADSPAYLGTDLIGTTRRVSNSAAYNPDNPGVTGGPPAISRTVLTAFGEPISTAGTGNTRYAYVGAWGYETPEQSFDPLADLGWLHVGVRYYDPAVGRFMQRDPIGIRGGTNVYGYVGSNPASWFDSDGLLPEHGFDFMAIAVGNREAGIPWEQSVKEWTHAHAKAFGAAGSIAIGAGGYYAVTGAYTAGAAWVAGPTGCSLFTSDPGFARWGLGWVPEAGSRIWRFAMGGPNGGWKFHLHIHKLNLFKPWKWFM